MPPKFKHLSGNEVVSIFKEFGFEVFSQRGSHVKLRRISIHNERQTLVVPNHKEIDVGTLRAIIRQASKYVSEENLREKFYSQ